MGPEGSLSKGLLWKTHTHGRPSKDGNGSFWKTLTVRQKAQQGSQWTFQAPASASHSPTHRLTVTAVT